MKNIVFQSSIYAEGDIHIGDVYHINGERREIPLHLNTLPLVHAEEIVGRDEELKELRTLMKDQDKAVLVSGIGGIGKTTMAKYFLEAVKAQFEYIAWIDVSGSIKEAFVNNVQLIDSLCLKETLSSLPKDAAWLNTSFDLIINRMRQLGTPDSGKKNLLILDNAQEDVEHSQTLDRIYLRPNWKVLATSRSQLIGFAGYELENLDPTLARTLFYRHYRQEQDDDKADRLLQTIDYHTLLIEVIAKTAQALRLQLDEILDRVKKKGLDISENSEIKLGHHYNQKVAHVLAYLTDMFQLADLSDYECWLLTQFSILPSVPIPYRSKNAENLLRFLQIPDDESRDTFTHHLNRITERGWLQWDASQDRFRMHQLIQEVIRNKLPPDVEASKVLIQSIFHLLGLQPTDNPIDKAPFLPYALSLQNYLPLHAPLMMALVNHSSWIQIELGQYPAAIESSEQLLAAQRRHAASPFLLAKNLINLAWYYGKIGYPDKAIRYSDEGILIFEALGDCQRELATAHHQVSQILIQKGDLLAARKHELASIELREQMDPLPKPALSLCYSNLAYITEKLGDYRGAIDYERKALKLGESVYPPEHPRLGVIYATFAAHLCAVQQFDEALIYQKKAQEIYALHYDPDHPELAALYSNLAWIYKNMSKLPEALEYNLKALKVFKQHLSPNHYRLSAVYNNLALILLDMNQLDRALRCMQVTLDIDQQHLHPRSVDLAHTFFNTALILYRKGNFEAAQTYCDDAIDILQDYPSHPRRSGYQALLEKIHTKLK